jgi:hypothetical protein
MNARANTAIDISSPEVIDRTIELVTKAHAIVDLIRCSAKTSADLTVVSTAAWAAQDMLEEAGTLNGWF